MSNGNGKTSFMTQIVIVVVAVMLVLGINSKVTQLEHDVSNLQTEVEQLSQLHERITTLRNELEDLEGVQDDILEAIRRAVRR